MANEVIRTHNDINILDFGTFADVDYDVFLALCIRLRNSADKRVSLSSDELREFIAYKGSNRDQFVRALVSTSDKLLNLKTRVYDEGVTGFNVFQAYHVPKDGSRVDVLFSEPARYLITDSVNQFIHAKWAEYKHMKTAYSRRLYLLLKQWRTAQKNYKNKCAGHKWPIDEWRVLMGIPISYKIDNIDQKVLNPAKRDFAAAGCFNDLRITKTKEGRGNRITHIEFTFTPEDKELFPETSKPADPKTKAEKIADLTAGWDVLMETAEKKDTTQSAGKSSPAANDEKVAAQEPSESPTVMADATRSSGVVVDETPEPVPPYVDNFDDAVLRSIVFFNSSCGSFTNDDGEVFDRRWSYDRVKKEYVFTDTLRKADPPPETDPQAEPESLSVDEKKGFFARFFARKTH